MRGRSKPTFDDCEPGRAHGLPIHVHRPAAVLVRVLAHNLVDLQSSQGQGNRVTLPSSVTTHGYVLGTDMSLSSGSSQCSSGKTEAKQNLDHPGGNTSCAIRGRRSCSFRVWGIWTRAPRPLPGTSGCGALAGHRTSLNLSVFTYNVRIIHPQRSEWLGFNEILCAVWLAQGPAHSRVSMTGSYKYLSW